MTELKGTIIAIDKENSKGHEKNVVTLEMKNNNVVFIEFQGLLKDLVKFEFLGKLVSIRIIFKGKTSNLGRKYNNIIGKSIKKIN